MIPSDARCAVLSAEKGEPLMGTAPRADAFVLLEVREAWAPKIEATALPCEVQDVLSRLGELPFALRVQFIRAPRRACGPLAVYACRVGRWLQRLAVDTPRALAAVDFEAWFETGAHPGAEHAEHPLTLVCTHGRRDVCCAVLGNPVFDALVREAACDQPERFPQVWQASHLGGHRFAPVLLSLPDGHCYGRVPVTEARSFLDAQVQGRVYSPANLRGRTDLEPWAQAADVAWRSATGRLAYEDVRSATQAACAPEGGEALHVSLDTSAGTQTVVVRSELRPGDRRPASCGDPLKPVVCFQAELPGVVPA